MDKTKTRSRNILLILFCAGLIMIALLLGVAYGKRSDIADRTAAQNDDINATQNNGVDMATLKSLIANVNNNIPQDIGEDVSETLNECLEVIEEELAKPVPKKSFLKQAMTTLTAMKNTAEFGAAQ